MASRMGAGRADELLAEAILDYGDVADHTTVEGDIVVQDDAPCHLWRDLPPSEAQRLRAVIEGARTRALQRARAVILEELSVGAKAFGEHERLRRESASV